MKVTMATGFFLQPGNRICRSRDVVFDEKVVTPTAGLDWPVKVNASPDECENGSISEHLTAKHDVLSDDAEKNTPEEKEVTDHSNMQNVPVMQLRDRKHISKPGHYEDFVLTAEGMLNASKPNNFDEAIHSNQSNEWQKAMENEMQSIKDN